MLFAPSAECKRLAEFDPSLRFGSAHIPGFGLSFALVKLVRPEYFGDKNPETRTAMTFTLDQVPGWCGLQGKDGHFERSIGSKVPVLIQWVGQRWGNSAVMNGDFVSACIHKSKPTYVYESERKGAASNHGKFFDNYCDDASRELSDYHKYLARDGTSTDFIYDKEHIRNELKKDYSKPFLQTLENDKEASFERQFEKDAGF